MKNKLLLLLLSFIATPVFAETIDCSAFSDITKPIAQAIMILAPIILIVLSAVDIFGVVTAGDEKSMQKLWDNIIKRVIICFVILILPLLVNLVVGWTVFSDLSACFK